MKDLKSSNDYSATAYEFCALPDEAPSALPPPEPQGSCERSRLATGSELRAMADRAAREILETWTVERYEEYTHGPIAGYAGSFTLARPDQVAEIIMKHLAPNAAYQPRGNLTTEHK